MKFFKKKEKKKQKCLEVSIIGGPLARYRVFENFNIKESLKFAYIKVEEFDRPILVKIRGISFKPARERLIELKPCSIEEIKKLLRNITMGMLFEEKLRDIRIVDTQLDVEKGIVKFTFIAEKRYDLSKIAPLIAKKLHLHVEFNQKGARDFAREIGGIGRCGRLLCCETWLKEIPPITLDMARKQYIFTAPENLTGICGRLLCCLRFELDVYEELSKGMPDIGTEMVTEKGVCKVTDVNVFRGEYKVTYENGSEEWIKVEDRW